MPVLKARADGSGHYIHASVRGAAITFQTTPHAVEKLGAAGVGPGAKFPLRLLADLTRDGDAYTRHGGGTSGAGYHEAEQFEFNFRESAESEGLFPACAVGGRFDDLHLVAHGPEGAERAELLSPAARAALREPITLSVPLAILSPGALARLESTGQLPAGTPAAAELRRWFAGDASQEWERLRRELAARQQQGFAFEEAGRAGR